MAIKIQTQQTFIPVEIGDLTLKFDVSDESLIKLRKKVSEVQDIARDIDVNGSDEEVLNQVKNVIGQAYDDIFGDGTFDIVYEISPSVLITTQYFMEIGQGIGVEMERRGFTTNKINNVDKYLQQKNDVNKIKNKQNNK